MKHIFMDINVVIDFLANRQPFALDAGRLFNAAIEKKVQIYIASVSYNNIYYILHRSLSHNATVNLLQDLYDMTEVIDVTDSVIRQSLKSDFKDYEDSIQYYSALSVPQIEFIVTSNTKDFRKSELAVLSPTEAIAAIV